LDAVRGATRTSVTQRLLSIIGCFDTHHREPTLTEISQKTGLPLSTVKRLTAELCRFGGLEKTDRNKFEIGLRLWRIGSLAPQARTMREAALPYMHDLFAATGQSVQLLTLHGMEAVVLEVISGHNAVQTRTDVGGRLPLHSTAVGKVLLAGSSNDFVDDVLARGLGRYTPFTVVEPGKLLEMVEKVREEGVGYCYEEMSIGAISVAAPIISPTTQILHGALGIVARTNINLDRLTPALKTAVNGIARSL
jgi:DNA-binding IclR family transcriptional regulator